jgi:GntR family phosphonate transport system transcriptional regulator
MNPPRPLARGAGVSLWRQIASAIEDDIARDNSGPGARLPTEAQLSARFAVNRHTVRRAMEELEARGLIRVEQGRGAFVAEDMLDYRVGPRTRFSENLRARGREPRGVILAVAVAAADSATASALRIRRGRPVLRIERLGLADGRPLLIGVHHLPLPRCAAAEAALARSASITAALAACGIADYRRAWTRISARQPTPEEASRLAQSRARPVLTVEALNLDPAGQPVDHTLSIAASARMQLLVEG